MHFTVENVRSNAFWQCLLVATKQLHAPMRFTDKVSGQQKSCNDSWNAGAILSTFARCESESYFWRIQKSGLNNIREW